jgi:putative thioredoxin
MTVDTENFHADVIEKSFIKPVLVDFWAEWCGPCKVLGPVLERMAEKYEDKFELVKLNTDHFPEIAQEYGIRGIPNVKLFLEGKVAGEFTGALPEPMVEEWIKKNIPGKNDKLLDQAKHLLESGRKDEAAKVLNILKQEEPENRDADILLAKINLFEDPGQAAEMVKGIEPSPEIGEQLESITIIAGLISRKQKNELPEGEVKAEYQKAVKYLEDQDFDNALGSFINIIRTDRSYDNDGARKACIAIFKYLGEENPVTLKHRRDFGSALYV